ncbi:MAG: two-component sensor histidine kinase [Oscillochloris sp.]|nr:two-component sensor histidine kinase [Oscillochloris sp.]
MIRVFQQLHTFVERHTPYPLALQGVITLILLITPISGLGLRDAISMAEAPQRYWAMTAIVGLHLIMICFVPARRLPLWVQITYLLIQCTLTATAQVLFVVPIFDYVYLAIVLQALTLFRPWLWIPFAVGVWALWSGSIIIASASALGWLQSNLALAFPATCVIIAAIIYIRQHRRSEQALLMLQQIQLRYDSLSTALREIQQRVALEERHRLAQLLTDEVQTALARTEQSVVATINQAQSNLSRLQVMVAQTRDSAGAAVERLRSAITMLRRGDIDEQAFHRPTIATIIINPLDELVISSQPYRILSWVLPIVFVLLSLLITFTQHQISTDGVLPLMALYALLLLAYIYTQRTRDPLLLQIGLAGQTLAVVALAIITQALPILLGLLLVLWQIALRLPLGQIVLFLVGTPTTISLLLIRIRPQSVDRESLLICIVAAMAVVGPLLLARRQLERRRQTELRAALLNSEIEQQTAEVRTLAVASERSRLAREFHDDLGSRLVLINLQLQLVEELVAEGSEDALAQLQTSREQLRAAWRSVLAVADAELPLTGGSLGAALTDLATQCRRSTAAMVNLEVDNGLENLDPAVACTIYRAVQEGMANACKHARSNQISVQISLNTSHATAVVINDDRPAGNVPSTRTESEATRGSYGLVGLRERAEALGGGMDAGPLPNGGFRLMLVLPVEGDRDG